MKGLVLEAVWEPKPARVVSDWEEKTGKAVCGNDIWRHPKLEVRSWPSERRMAQAVDFAWEPGIWYTMKMKVEVAEDKAVVMGKVWKRGEAEPTEWTIRVEDATPIPAGSPGLVGYSPADI